MSNFTHSALCSVAVKWLRRSWSQNGAACCVAVSEAKSGWHGEIPDAIGFRRKGHRDGSVVVEVKVSRSDFLADAKKPHRASGGIGNRRYFMCPEGMISVDELPAGWGLLVVNARGHVKKLADATAWFDADADREQFILVRLLSRVGDAEALNKELKEARRERQRLAKRCDDLNLRLKQSGGKYWQARNEEQDATEALEALKAKLAETRGVA